MITIDCRGQGCPAPVIETKKGLELHPDGVVVLLDSGPPRENVRRFAQNRGWLVSETDEGGFWALQITASGATPEPESVQSGRANGESILLITSDQLGNGPEELGRLLMKNFIFTLLETAELPNRILLLNSGVKLAVNGADTVEALNTLVQMGVSVASCGLCLDFFDLKDRLAVGETTNMFTIAELLLRAGSVIRL
jgi:selenium metabolism protein YedF